MWEQFLRYVLWWPRIITKTCLWFNNYFKTLWKASCFFRIYLYAKFRKGHHPWLCVITFPHSCVVWIPRRILFLRHKVPSRKKVQLCSTNELITGQTYIAANWDSKACPICQGKEGQDIRLIDRVSAQAPGLRRLWCDGITPCHVSWICNKGALCAGEQSRAQQRERCFPREQLDSIFHFYLSIEAGRIWSLPGCTLPTRIPHSLSALKQPMKRRDAHPRALHLPSRSDPVRQPPMFSIGGWRPPSTCCVQRTPKKWEPNGASCPAGEMSGTGGRGGGRGGQTDWQPDRQTAAPADTIHYFQSQKRGSLQRQGQAAD